MKLTFFVFITFAINGSVLMNPVLKEVNTWMEELEPEDKIREKRKSDLFDHLQAEKIGMIKSADDEDADRGKLKGDGEIVKVELTPPEDSSDVKNTQRTKKQAHDNVCIEDMNNGGKTSCGRIISARGPSAKMIMRTDPVMMKTGRDVDTKPERYSSMQSRTFDPLFPLASLTSSVAYAVPTATVSGADAIAHTVPTTIAAPALPVTHLEPLSVISHTIPVHPMHAMLAHRPLVNLNLQRMELPKLQEVYYTPAEVKQPAYEVKPIVTRPVSTTPFLYSSRYGSVNSGYDAPMICHPLGDERASQQVIQIRPEVHVIESGQKILNSSAEEFKSQFEDGNEDGEQKMREQLRQVNEIREEISQLNKAAQRIVDQQERLAEMQQRHLWRSDDKGGNYSPYNNPRIFMIPPTYTRANALAYPNAMDDIEFFVNLMKTAKNFGTLSNSFQPAIVSALDATKLVLGGDQNGQINSSQSKQQRENSENSQSKPDKSNNTK